MANGGDLTLTGSTVSGSTVGVLVGAGGTATIIDNDSAAALGGNTTGVQVDGGTALIENNDLTGNTVGLHVLNDGLVDAGDVVDDADVTGLGTGSLGGGSSAGENVLTGYPADSATSFAILDDNQDASANLDVQAEGNDFGTAILSLIERVVLHTEDDAARTRVFFESPIAPPPATPVWVNDDWAGAVLGTDPDLGDGLAVIYGVDAFDVIQDGVNAVAVGGTVNILASTDNTHLASDVIVGYAQTIQGSNIDGTPAAAGDVIVAPALVDAMAGTLFAAGSHNGFVIASGDVTVQNLTVDGTANDGALGAGPHYRGGIVVDPASPAGNNVTVNETVVQNTATVGIYLDGGASALSSGHVVSDNTVQNIGKTPPIAGDIPATGILLIQASATVSGNTIDNATRGLTTTTLDGAAYALTLAMTDNLLTNVDVGLQLDGLAAGSTVGGPTAADANTINLPVTGPTGFDDNLGILITNAAGTLTIEGNTITGSGPDAGVWALGASDVQLTGNQITATTPSQTQFGDAVGVLLSDDGTLVGNPDQSTTATLTGNTISGFAQGLLVDQSAPGGLTATAATIDGNDISGNGTGILVFEADAGANGFNANLSIAAGDDLSGLTGNDVGIDLDGAQLTIDGKTVAGNTDVGIQVANGGDLTLTGSTVSGSTTGVRVGPGGTATIISNPAAAITGNTTGIDVDGGTALVQTTDLNGNTVGLLIQGGGTVDAGQDGAGTNFTGLGVSTGGNDFSGYSTAATASAGAIVNLNGGAPYSAAGSQGLPFDVTAFNNTFFATTAGAAESVIHHDADDSAVGFVDFADLGNLTIDDPAPVLEGTGFNLTGSFDNDGQAHTVTIDWDDATADTVLNLLPGVFTFSAPHSYPDGPFSYNVSVTVEEVATSNSVNDSIAINVQNVAPTIALSGLTTINEATNYTLTLGAVTDPGADTITDYVVFWGDGTSDTYGSTGAKTHYYDDDAAVVGPITVTLVDEDGVHAGAGTLNLTVNNVPPTALTLDGGPVNEGTSVAILFLSQDDVSNADDTAGFTYGYDFNNDNDFGDPGELASTPLANVTVPGVYIEDDPTETVRMVIRDKDGGETEYLHVITVNNVDPAVDAGPDALVATLNPAFQGVPFVQAGAFTDPGVDDWTATVDYGEGAGPGALTLVGKTFTLNHTYGSLGQFTITVSVDDGDGGIGTDQVIVDVVHNTFRVTDFVTNASGFDATFNRAADLLPLNLYDSSLFDATLDAPDITVVRNGTETIEGSMVWDETANMMSFVKTGGVLEPGSYAVTLVSSTDAFQDTLGELLDGDSNFTAGGDYTNTFTVANSSVIVSLPDFARGPDQDVDIPAATPGSGLPISIDDATGVLSIDVDVLWDPALLNIPSAALASGLPADWSITQNLIAPGELKLTASGTTSLTGTDVSIFILDADVPESVKDVYGDSHVVRLTNLRVNEDNLASKADLAIHKAAYLGDTDASGDYLAFDAGLISRVVVLLDTGYDAHRWTDPLIVGDTTGEGTLSGLDASYVAQKSVLLPRPEIPDLPVPALVVTHIGGGVDPQLSIPVDVAGRPGAAVVVPVNIDIAPGETTVISSTFDVFYDPAVLSITDGDVANGAFWPQSSGWTVIGHVVTDGHMRVSVFDAVPSATGAGEIVTMTFTVDGGATAGSTPLDIEPVNRGEGGLTWTESDGSVLVDDVAPIITAVQVGSTAWLPAFSTALGGDAYTMPTGADQVQSLTWVNLDQVSLVFSEDVDVAVGDLAIAGVNVPGYAITGFGYNSTTHTATWTLGSVIGPDKLVIALPDTVQDAAGNALDGEWTNVVSTQSGDGTAGGAFRYRANVLPGDIDSSGIVLGNDVTLVRLAQFTPPTSPTYPVRRDVNGTGSILGSDVTLTRNGQFTFLPAAEPVAPLGSATADGDVDLLSLTVDGGASAAPDVLSGWLARRLG